MRRAPRLIPLAWLAVLLAACGADNTQPAPGVTPDEIVIGSTSALSGHAGYLGTQYTRGSQAYFSEVNRSGGIHGRKIRLVTYDDQYDPPKTVANTTQLIEEDRVFMLFDYVGTPTSVEVIEAVHQAEIPALGFFTGAERLRTPLRPFMFHVRASYYAEAEGAVRYFADHLGIEKIAVMYQDDAFGLAVLRGVQLAMGRRHLEVCATDTYLRGTMDVERAAETLQASGADAIVMVGTYSPLARFIKACHEREFRPYFHTVSFVGSAAFGHELREVQEVDPSQYERILVTQVVPSPFDDGIPAVRQYRDLAERIFPDDEPNYVALEGFINARVLVEALRAAGPRLDRVRLMAALEDVADLDVGIGKSISYGGLDRTGLDDVYYSHLGADGKFRVFTPE